MLFEAFKIGPFLFKVNWLIIMISWIIGYQITLLFVKRIKEESLKNIKEAYINASILAIILWKFSYVIFHPLLSFKNPYSLLFFTGDRKGVLVAIIGGVCFYLWQNRNKIVNAFAFLLKAISITIITYYICLLILQPTLLYAIQLFVILGLTLYYMYQKDHDRNSKKSIEFVLWFTLAQIFIGFLDGTSGPYYGLSYWQWVYGIVAIVSLCTYIFLDKKV